ncbi:UNVERIFIED_CONTAM: hypothetical protein Slati_1515100 [Sesamum latifolium]|uniref:Uncharacterized protein n=1 Tax=Sesamum latifolium TaxID=2727402 RepID=A0AAW2X6B1_9LAMI
MSRWRSFRTVLARLGFLPCQCRGIYSTGPCSLWKRLDRIFVNDRWLDRWPEASYSSLNPRTSDHSPLVLRGDLHYTLVRFFRFDNYLAASPDFIPTVQKICRHHVVGTVMYSVTRKLKALKPKFRQQRTKKGDLFLNVKLAKEYLDIAQDLLRQCKHNPFLLQLDNCSRMVYLKAVKLEQSMLQQHAKLQWLKGGDHCTRIFFRRVAARRASIRIFQINSEMEVLTPRLRRILLNSLGSISVCWVGRDEAATLT